MLTFKPTINTRLTKITTQLDSLFVNSRVNVMKFRSFSKKTPFLSYLCLLLLSLSISMPAAANKDDWVLVDRFKRQLSSAKAGKLKAMYDVGKLYERGRGTNIDLKLAAEWYQKAADGGQTSAQSRLGIMYFEGRGVKQNYGKALQLLNSAAKDNVPSAQYQLANMYELGTGVPQDIEKAIHWYTQSDKFGYYLAKAKVIRLKKILQSSGNSATQKTVVASKAAPKAKTKKSTSQAIKIISSGLWFKRKKAVGYLPSNISNCASESYNTLHCISTSQERSTGSEIIAYNTESDITMKNKNSFTIDYTNNVLEVTPLSVEDGDGQIIEKAPSRIKKGQKGKKRSLQCEIKDKKLISCTKGSSSFNLVTR